MFIKSSNPAPVGTVLSFEFKLKDNFTLIQGLGEVVWVRQANPQSLTAGMGIRFRELSPQSKQLISTMIANHVSKGGEVFQLDTQEDNTRSLPFFDTGETEVHIKDPPSMDASLDRSNLEALFDVPLLEPTTPLNAPGESTKKDLDSLFSGETFDDKGIVSVPPKGPHAKGSQPKEFTKPEYFQKSESRSRRWIWILLGLILSSAGGAWFYRREVLLQLKGLPLPESLRAWLPLQTETQATPVPPKPPTPAPTVVAESATPLHDTPSTPLEAAIEANAPETIPAKPSAMEEKTKPARVDSLKQPFTRIEKILWENIQGGFVLSIITNGRIDDARYSYVSIPDSPPREVIKVTGVGEKFKPSTINVQSEFVRQIRVGHHLAHPGFDIHLVVDLIDGKFRISRTEVHEKMVQFYFQATN